MHVYTENSSKTLTALLLLAGRDLHQQCFVHAGFLYIHHAAQLEFLNEMCFLTQWHWLRHLRLNKLCVHDCVLFQLEKSVSLPLVQGLLLLSDVDDVLAISIRLLNFTLLFLRDLRFQVLQHLNVLPPSFNFCLQVLLSGLLILHQTLLDVLLLSFPNQFLVVFEFDIAHSRHDFLNFCITFSNLSLPLNHSLLFRMHFLQNQVCVTFLSLFSQLQSLPLFLLIFLDDQTSLFPFQFSLFFKIIFLVY